MEIKALEISIDLIVVKVKGEFGLPGLIIRRG